MLHHFLCPKNILYLVQNMAKSNKKRFVIVATVATLCIASTVMVALSLNMGEDKTQNNNEVLSKEPQASRKEEIAITESKNEEAVAENKSEEAIAEAKAKENGNSNNKHTAEARKEKPAATNAPKDSVVQTEQESPKSDEHQEDRGKDEQGTNENEEAKQTETDAKEETDEPSEPDSTEDGNDTTEPEAESERLKELAKQYSVTITHGDPKKGGYPYSERCPEEKDKFADQWGMYICESASYAAWRVYDAYGYMPYWGGKGNPKQWPANARAAGYAVSNTPKVGAVGISMGGAYGHAVWVEAVSGNRVYVSQYNAINAATNNTAGEYSEQWVDQGMYQYIYFK